MVMDAVKTNVTFKPEIQISNVQNIQPDVIKPVEMKEQKYDLNKEKENKQPEIIPQEKVQEVVDEVNKRIRPVRTCCEFKYLDDSNRIAITVKNADTDEVIKEIPSEKILDILQKTIELAGMIVDEKR